MNPLSDEQRAQLTNYLSGKSCEKCGSTEWEFGEIEVVAADLTFGSQKVTPTKGPFVEVTCRSCGAKETVYCDDAGISDC